MKMATMRSTPGATFLSQVTSFHKAGERSHSSLRMLLLTYGTTLLLLGAVAAASLTSDVPMSYFLEDAASTLKAPNYIGLVSNVGVLLWCVSSALCFFAYAVLRKTGVAQQPPAFFLAAGLVTTALLIDDLFMLHEHTADIHWRFNEEVVFLLYGGMFLLFLGKFWRTIAASQFLFLVLAFGFMGASLVFDQLKEGFANNAPSIGLMEDGFKLLGIVTWLVYFARTCLTQVLFSLTPNRYETQEYRLPPGQ